MIQYRQFPCKPRHFPELFEEYGAGSIARLPEHQNGGFEVHYIAEGHLHWEIEGRPFLVPPRSAFFTFPWEKHGSCMDFEPGHFFHFVVFRLQDHRETDPRRIRLVELFGLSEPEQSEIFRSLASVRRRCVAASLDFGHVVARLTRELTEPGKMARTNVIALSCSLLCELVRCIRVSQIQHRERSLSEQRVLEFVDKLRSNCSQPWTLDSMAAACGLKRTQFEILTKELTGDAPLILLNRFRVRLAQSSLKESDETITDIAFGTGFGSSQYFSQVFKCVAGMTPSEYRHQRGNFAAYDQRFRKVLAELKS